MRSDRCGTPAAEVGLAGALSWFVLLNRDAVRVRREVDAILGTAVSVWRGREPEASERSLQAILFWGVMSVVLGTIGTVGGLVVMTQAILAILVTDLLTGAIGRAFPSCADRPAP